MLKELREKHPDKDLDQLIEMANYATMQKQHKWLSSFPGSNIVKSEPRLLKPHRPQAVKLRSRRIS